MALWGLVRSAQSEHPGRLTLIDTDGVEASEEALLAILALEEEPQLALRPLARAGMLPPLLSGLVRTPGRRSKAPAGSFARRFATIPEAWLTTRPDHPAGS